MKLTKAQERAKAKLTHEWQCANDMKERLVTLDGLVTRNIAEKRLPEENKWPRPLYDSIHYRLL